MKQRFLILFAAICCFLLAVSAAAADNVVYLDGTGKTAGAYTDFKAAVSALPSGGTVIVSGDTTVGTASAGVTLGAVGGKVTVTGQNGAKFIFARSLTLSSELEFNNINFHSTATASGNILCRGNTLTIGEGVNVTVASGAWYPAIFGGTTSNVSYDSHLIIRSGTWRAIYGGNYSATFSGNSLVEISGAESLGNLSGQNWSGTFSGKSTLIVDLRGNKTVTANPFKETPTILVDEGYEAVLDGNTYMQHRVVTEETVYVDGTGATAGAFTSLEEALTSFVGGKVVVCGDTTLDTAVTVAEKERDILLTSENGARLTLAADLAFAKNTNGNTVTFDLPVLAENAKIFGGFHTVTFTENFVVDGSLDYYGGVDAAMAKDNASAIAETAFEVTVNGGRFANFALGNYRGDIKAQVGSLAAPVALTVNDGIFDRSFSLSGMSILADDAVLTVNGGVFNCPVYIAGGMNTVVSVGVAASGTVASDRKYYAMDGDVTVNIGGGSFNGGVFGAYKTQVAYTQLMRGNYEVNVTGGSFADGTVFDATQVKAYAGENQRASIVYPASYDFDVVRFDLVNGTTVTYTEPRRVAYVGDSITEGYAAGVDRLTQAYPAVLDALAKKDGVDIVSSNFGISSAGILPSSSYYFPSFLGYALLLEETDADDIVIALGTNDSGAGGTTGALRTFETQYQALVAALGAIPTTKKVYITNALIRNNETNAQIRVASVVRPTQEAIAKAFEAQDGDKYVFVDLYRLTMPTAAAGKLLSADNLHPNAAGYAKMAEILYGVMFRGEAPTTDAYKKNDVYVSASGSPFGSGTKEDPTSRLDLAFAMFPAGEEATLHIVGEVAFAESLYLPITPSKLTVVGEGEGAVLQNGSVSFKIGCDVVFDDLTLATTASTEIYGCYNDVTMTDTVMLTGDWSFFAGHNIYAEGEKSVAHDTVASASSDDDCTIRLLATGAIKNFALGNRRCSSVAPFGTYGGHLDAYLGERLRMDGDYVGIVGQNYLTGSIAVEMPETLTLAEYAPTYTVNAPIVYDSAKNTGTVNVTRYAATAPEGILVDGTGATAGAYTTFADAFRALSAEGGKIIVCGDTQLGTTAKGVTLADYKQFTGKITIVGENGARLIFARSLRLNTALEFADIHIHSIIPQNLSAVNNIICSGNTLTIGAGVTVTKDDGTIYPAIIGGHDANTSYDSHLVIHGGTWQNVWGGGYSGTFAGTSSVEATNATVVGTLTAGSRAGTFSGTGTLTLDLRGGKTVKAGAFAANPTLLTDEGYEGVLIGDTYMERLPVDKTPKTLYLDGTGKTEGAYTSLSAALADMPGGGTLVICGDVNISSAVTISTEGQLLITSVYEDEDYTDRAVIRVGANISLGCPVTFRDVVLDKVTSGNAYIFANGNRLVIDEGVFCRNNLASNYIILVGGAQSGRFVGNSEITVKSGFFRNIHGGNLNGTFVGNSTVNFLGGFVDNMITGGTFMGNFEGDATVNIGGDAVMFYSGSGSGVQGASCGSGNEQYTFAGDIHVNLYGNSRVNQNVYGTTRWPNVTVTGDVYVTIKDDAFVYQNLYAGGYSCTLNGNTSVVMDGGWVGVNLAAGSRSGIVNGDTYLEINGGKVNYYATNIHSSVSDPAGTYNTAGGGLTGTVNGNTTVKINGGDIYGSVYGGAIDTGKVTGNATVTVTGGSVMCGIYADGATAGSVAGTGTLDVDLSGGETFAVGLSMDVHDLVGGGKLILFPEAVVTADTFSGALELEINGKPQARDYITATAAQGASVDYTPQNGEPYAFADGVFTISPVGYFAKTRVTFLHVAGVEVDPRCGIGASGAKVLPVESTATSTTFEFAPGLYNCYVRHSASDYKRVYVYINGEKEEIVLDYTVYEPKTGNGFQAATSFENTKEIYDTFYDNSTLVGYETPDSPYFINNRYGTRQFTTDVEMNAFIREKTAACDYAYVYDLFTSTNGTVVPAVLFTKDDIPEGATLEEAAAIVTAQKGRDIILIGAQVHGNEPSGGEGALAMISEMCGDYGNDFLSGNIGAVVIVPRLNPSGSRANTRSTSFPVTMDSGKAIDNLNRDYAMLSSPEITGFVHAFNLFEPTVNIDCHEAGLTPNWGKSQTLTDIYDVGVMSCGILNTPFVDTTEIIKGNYNARDMRSLNAVTAVLHKIDAVGLRPYYYQMPMTFAANANPYGATRGAYTFLVEVPGLAGADNIFARRVFAHVTTLKSIFAVTKESNGKMAEEVIEAREALALAAQKFDENSPVVLFHQYTRHDHSTVLWNNPLVGSDATVRRAENITMYYLQDAAVKYRARPTAYVVAKGTAGLDKVLLTLDKHAISYYELAAGTALTLKRYSGSASAATLGAAAEVTFASGAYIIPVDGHKAYLISTLFEPECLDSGEEINTFVQAGYLAASDIYRSEESYIAAKLGLDGTYIALDTDGKTVANAVVDGVTYDDVDTEDGKAFTVKGKVRTVLSFTDGTSKIVGQTPGDANGDGNITLFDAMSILRSILNQQTVAGGDVNGDGKTTLADVLRVLKLLAQ